jgi:RNA polymerase sigma-70 factor (ECF subfamily)
MSASDPTDSELVHQALAGDPHAFARLYDRYARLVRAVATDAGPTSAEDVTQEAFLRAYRTLGSLRSPERFAPWLVGIARLVTREWRRCAPGEAIPAEIPGQEGPNVIDDQDEVAFLHALVARLPDEERQVIQFFFLNGRNAVETARLLGRSRSGVYVLIRSALARLARWMKADRPAGEATR